MFIRAAGILSVLVAAAILAAAPAHAGKYTGPGLVADLVLKDPSLGKGRITGKYHFDRGGSRMQLNGKTKFRSIIFNSFAETLITINADSRVNVDLDRGKALAALFGDEPCGGFKRAIRLGAEPKYGRTIHVWRCDQPRQVLRDAGFRHGYKVTVWYDEDLKHFIRKEDNNGMSIELRNIIAARQAPSLFDVPADFATLRSADRLAEVEAPQ